MEEGISVVIHHALADWNQTLSWAVLNKQSHAIMLVFALGGKPPKETSISFSIADMEVETFSILVSDLGKEIRVNQPSKETKLTVGGHGWAFGLLLHFPQ